MEVDDVYLMSVLDKLSQDLSVPFLERRGREHCHKRSAMGTFHLEELREAVETLNERERELLAAIGIAKMLLEKGQKTINSLAQMREEQDLLEQAVRGYKQEIALFREQLTVEEEKNEALSSMLGESEANVEKLRELKLHYEQFLKSREGGKNDNQYERLLEEAKEALEQRQQVLESRTLAFQRDRKELASQISSLESSLNEQTHESSQLRLDLANALHKSSGLERELASSKAELRTAREEYRLKDLDVRVLRKQLEGLKEELEFSRPMEDYRRGRTIHQSFLGGDLWEDEDSPPTPSKPHIEQQDSIEIVAETARKDPSQEYFTLVSVS
jgi:chromosome segregation ATPase